MPDSAARLIEPTPSRNPYYLASAASMLLGCYVISRALAVTPGQQMKLVALVGVLNVYEFLLIAGAVILLTRAGQLADGRTLLLMEIPFLFDVAFLHSELAGWSGGLSLMTAWAAALLAAGKMMLLSRYLHWPSERRAVAVPALMLTLVLAAPVAFAALARAGLMSIQPLYAAWWGVSLLPTLGILHSSGAQDPFRLGRAILGVGYASLCAHLLSAHWVYDVRVYLGCMSPMLIGASVYAVLGPREWSPRRSRERAALGSLALALVLSSTAPPDLLGQVLGLSVGPLRLVLLAATIVATVGFWRHRRSPYLWGAAVSTLLLVGGHTPEAIVERVGQWTGGLLRLFGMVWPQTQVQWGVLALAGAFVLLAFGLHRSLGDNRRSRGGA